MHAAAMYAGMKAGGESGAELAWFAPVGTTLPTEADPFAALDPAFTSAGLCTQDGYTQNQDLSSEDVFSFGILTPTLTLKTQQKTTGTITFQETNAVTLAVYNSLPLNAVTFDAQGRATIKQGPIRTQRYSCVIDTIFGANRLRLVMPEVEPQKNGDFKISMGAVTERGIQVTAYPDATGGSVYEHYLMDVFKTGTVAP